MRQEKRAFNQQVKLRFFELGLDEALAGKLILKPNIELTAGDREELMGSPRLSALQAQIDVFDSQIKAARLKDAPRLSLYGLYGYDEAGGSQFGEKRTLNGYEVGLAVSWNFFDRGINRAEARRISYLKKAKEAEMRAAPSLQQRAVEFARQKVADAKQSLNTQNDQVAYQNNILKSTERSYREGGDKSYINMVNAFLTYEAIIRQRIHSEFDYIQTQVELAAAESSWSPDLIRSLDDLFVSGE
jgi:outer membrane protein TolC